METTVKAAKGKEDEVVKHWDHPDPLELSKCRILYCPSVTCCVELEGSSKALTILDDEMRTECPEC